MNASLRGILTDHSEGIVIPRLQRDYAQGRPGVRDVRERFIDDLFAALSDPDRPLDLDFVYGTPDLQGHFSPLDGQQRLTTLFLLHWYLATRDGALDDFRTYAAGDAGARFSYHVRPSAKDFFDALVSRDIDLDDLLPDPLGHADAGGPLSRTIEDQPWFFQSWRLDPTVVSCLTVLDTIHARFGATRGLYARLIGEPSAITFQFLDLKAFKLTDDLYIKMNARGKPLTPFETFKASFEAYVGWELPTEEVDLEGTFIPLQRYVAQRFDTAWCDLFWSLHDETHTHDTLTMNMLRAIALVALERHGNAERIEAINSTLDALRGARREGIAPVRTFFDYREQRLLSPAFVRSLVHLLDGWARCAACPPTHLRDTLYYDEAALFRRVAQGETEGRERVTMEEWVQFAGWCDYLLFNRPLDGLRPWMRLVTNLARNTIYNRADELRSSLHALQGLVEHAGPGLIESIADGAVEITGFNRQQVREERLKAQLMVRDARWCPVIEQAESHPYFRGQIEFLLAFSGVLARWSHAERCDWSDEQDDALRRAFESWSARAAAVFAGSGDEPGVRPLPRFLWERALLCEGDYLLPSGSNWSFLENGGRETSWKRLLRADLGQSDLLEKRDIVRRVLEGVDPDDVEGSLQAHIDGGIEPVDDESFAGWRERLVAHPALIGYCKKRQIRWDEGEAVYLLSKQRRSADHKELFSAHLELELGPRVLAGEFAPFDRIACDHHWGATEHWLRLWSSTGTGEVLVGYWDGAFEVRCAAEWMPDDQDLDENGAIWVDLDAVEATLAAIANRAGR